MVVRYSNCSAAPIPTVPLRFVFDARTPDKNEVEPKPCQVQNLPPHSRRVLRRRLSQITPRQSLLATAGPRCNDSHRPAAFKSLSCEVSATPIVSHHALWSGTPNNFVAASPNYLGNMSTLSSASSLAFANANCM